MLKEYFTFLNFQATSIELIVASKIVNDNIKIIASATSDYAGYIDGKFLDEDGLENSIITAKEKLESNLGKKIKSIYVGVPAEFCNYALKNLKASYPNKIVIKKKNIQDLFESIDDNEVAEDYTVISKSPIYYVLDSVQTMDPEFAYSKNLGVKASLILAKKSFITTISDILDRAGVKSFEYVPVMLAIGITLLPESVRQIGAIIINFDYVSTSIFSIMGDGIVDLKTFAVGDGHITADLCEVMKLNYFNIQKLKKQIILTLQSNPMDNYEIKDDSNNIVKVNASLANEVVKARLDSIAETLDKLLINFQYKQEDGPIYITGTGITYLKGVENYMTNVLHRECEILSPMQVEFNSPKYAEIIGLLKFVIDTKK